MKKLAILMTILTMIPITAWTQQEVSRLLDTTPDGTVEVQNLAGSVTIIGWERNQVEIQATLGEGVEELEIDPSEGAIEISVKPLPDVKMFGDTHLTIHVPLSSTLEVETVAADIDIKEVTGELELASVSGDITVGGSPESVEAECVSGDIILKGVRDGIEAASVSGNIILQGVRNDVEAENVSGKIHVIGDNLGSGEFEVVSGNLLFEGTLHPEGSLECECFSGTVEIRLPASISADFDIETFSGTIVNDFGVEATSKDSMVSGQELQFSTGSGDADISVETFSGTIRLIKI